MAWPPVECPSWLPRPQSPARCGDQRRRKPRQQGRCAVAQHDHDQFVDLIGPVAQRLLGDPNRQQSTKTELRWGSHGSFSVDLEKGTWFDHEANEGGGVLDLVKREKGLTGRDGVQWLEDEGFHIEPTGPRA